MKKSLEFTAHVHGKFHKTQSLVKSDKRNFIMSLFLMSPEFQPQDFVS